MKITIIITSILFFYAAFSTIFLETSLVGNIGEKIGTTNIHLFGYFAYINIFILFYPFYKLYTDVTVRKKWDFYMGWLLFLVALIIFFSLVLQTENIGYVGTQVTTFLHPYIGQAGLWMLWLMSVMLSLLFIIDDDFSFSDLNQENSDSDLWRVGLTKLMLPLKFIKEKISSLATFTSTPLEDELMPLMERKKEDEIKAIKIKRKAVDKKPIRARKEPKTIVDTIKDKENAKQQTKVEKSEIEKKEALHTLALNSNVEIVEELEENSKLMDQIEKGNIDKPKNFKLPKLDFLQKAPKATKKINEVEIDKKIEELLAKLKHFKVDGDVIRTYSGPLVTTFEFKPAPNVKVSKILNLQDDLAMALSAETIRIQAPIPGRDVVGIEIPNEKIETIYLREILEDRIFKESKSSLTVALGKDIVGKPFITDLKKLPHLLIAGTTGSGKSVGINAMILSLLYRNDPNHLKLMLIDPKMLEFSMYNDIPHLITPVITEPIKAIAALANMVGEMERRYKLMAESRTKNIENYNEKVKKDGSAETFPFIVVVIDELADLMMNGGKEVELSIARLAQKSRACGIHLIVATQRPSVDVVTGLIKANLPSRLSYRVGQRIDSKVILDAMGAESLLGRGDGLFTPPGSTGLVRIHAPWNTEDEIDDIVEFLKAQRLPEYDESYLVVGGTTASSGENKDVALDALYEEAKSIILTDKKTSISYLQRKLQIGYNRSANIIEQLEAKGVLSPPNAKGNREIV
ncbi:MAG: DNA translocase FtsK [Campylobacterota bacterium]|nr:DNA translocase FtsK [Campylobacterota bacterium]